MKTLKKETRPLTEKETKALRKIKNTNQRVVDRGYKWPNVFGALLLAAACLYLATWTRYDLITFLLGTSAVFSLGYVFFMPYEAFKDIRRAKAMMRTIDVVTNTGTIEVSPVNATRVAMSKEYEDEGDLYIVEMDNGRILYIWDSDHNLRKGFPCLQFELYDPEFSNLIGRIINPLSEKIKPIAVDAESKWKYLKKTGAPEQFEIQKKDFDKLIGKMGASA